jgi:hypothetical protein
LASESSESLAQTLGPKVSAIWAKSRLRDRIDAIIAHEHYEGLGLSHDETAALAPDTPLGVREGARRILRAIAEHKTAKGSGS